MELMACRVFQIFDNKWACRPPSPRPKPIFPVSLTGAWSWKLSSSKVLKRSLNHLCLQNPHVREHSDFHVIFSTFNLLTEVEEALAMLSGHYAIKRLSYQDIKQLSD